MGFTTCTYLGEHVGFLNSDWKNVPQLIPNNVAKTVYNPLNTGVPMTLCIQNMWPHLRNKFPGWYPKASIWTDLYRMDINTLLENPMAKEGLEQTRKMNAISDFGADESIFYPYWEKNNQTICNGLAIEMSAFKRKDGALLLIIMNFSDIEISGNLDFNHTRNNLLKLPDQPVCKTLIDKLPVKIENGLLPIKLRAYEGLRLIITPNS